MDKNIFKGKNPELFRKIMNLDLEPVRYFLSEYNSGPLWNIITANQVELLYRQFLYIQVQYTDFRAVPTDYIDEFWHTHILMTERYHSDCNYLCNEYIHHDPLFGTRSDYERNYYTLCKKKTLLCFQEDFQVTRDAINLIEA